MLNQKLLKNSKCILKARKSKKAIEIFKDEKEGRKLLRDIYNNKKVVIKL